MLILIGSGMNDSTKTTIIKVLTKVTGKKIDKLNMEADLKSQLNLDSIQIVELFAALEKELEVELPLSMMTVRTGKAFMEILEEQLRK